MYYLMPYTQCSTAVNPVGIPESGQRQRIAIICILEFADAAEGVGCRAKRRAPGIGMKHAEQVLGPYGGGRAAPQHARAARFIRTLQEDHVDSTAYGDVQDAEQSRKH